MNYKTNKQSALKISGLFLMLMLCFYTFFLYSPKIVGTDAINYSEKLSEFPIGTLMQIEYITPHATHSKKLSIDSSFIVSADKTKLLQEAMHYTVFYTAQISEQSYLDIEMQINKQTNDLTTIISSLTQQSNVSLMIGDKPYYTAIPADWAGHLTLQLKNTTPFIGNNVCLTINNPTAPVPSKICHHILKGGKA